MRRSIVIIILFGCLCLIPMTGSADTEQIYLEENDTIIVEYQNPGSQPDFIRFDEDNRTIPGGLSGRASFTQDRSSWIEIESDIIEDMFILIERRPMKNQSMKLFTSGPIIVERFNSDVNRTVIDEKNPIIDLNEIDSIDDRYEIKILNPRSFRGTETRIDETPPSFTILPTERSDRVPIGLFLTLIIVGIGAYIWYDDDEEESWRS